MKSTSAEAPSLGRSTSRSFGILEVWLVAVVGACAFLAIFLATSARPTSLQKAAQAAVFAGVFLTALPVLLGSARRQIAGPVLAVYAGVGLFALPAITQHYFRLSWFVGDILLLSVPALIGLGLWVVSREHPRFLDRTVFLFVGSLFVAALVAPMFPDAADHNRYSPPAPLLMAAAWVAAMRSEGSRRLAAIAGVGVVAVLTWGSQWRSFAAVFAVIAAVVLWTLLRSHARVLLSLSLGMILIVIFGYGVDPFPGKVAEGSDNRLVATFAEGGLSADSSTAFRFIETRAVLLTVEDEWSPVNYLMGAGHGSTYNISHLETLPGSRRFEDRNSADGRVHNVHLGLAALPYRYGLLGVGLVLFLLILVARRAVTAARTGHFQCFSASVAALGCAILYIANNVTTQLHFSMTVAVLIPLILRMREESAESVETRDHQARRP